MWETTSFGGRSIKKDPLLSPCYSYGKSLLIDAVSRENVEDVKWLTTCISCSVNDHSNDGRTPLGTTIVQENLEIVKMLIEKGADANMTNEV